MIWILAISMALEQIGLARQTVITAFSIVFGALMLALAIAFGLGGRDLARQTLERDISGKRKMKAKKNRSHCRCDWRRPPFWFAGLMPVDIPKQ